MDIEKDFAALKKFRKQLPDFLAHDQENEEGQKTVTKVTKKAIQKQNNKPQQQQQQHKGANKQGVNKPPAKEKKIGKNNKNNKKEPGSVNKEQQLTVTELKEKLKNKILEIRSKRAVKKEKKVRKNRKNFKPKGDRSTKN